MCGNGRTLKKKKRTKTACFSKQYNPVYKLIYFVHKNYSLDRVPVNGTMDGGLWHCTGGSDQDIPKKKRCKKAKCLSEEALQIAEERREAKGKGDKEKYTHLNAEFQRIPRRDKAFLRGQCQEIEENNRMGKTRDLFKKSRGTKGTFHAKLAQWRAEMMWT